MIKSNPIQSETVNENLPQSALRMLIYILMILSPFLWSKQINGNYYNAKMFLIYMIGGLCLVHISFSNRILTRFNIPKTAVYAGLFFITYLLLQPLFTFNFYNYLYLFKPLSFITICYFVGCADTAFFHKKMIDPIIWICIFSLISFHIYEIYQFRVLQDTIDHGHILGTFGNVNMLSEFFILFLPFIYKWTNQTEEKNKLKIFIKYFLMSLWIFIILYSRSRSAWIGLILFVVYILYKNFNKKNVLSFSLGLALYLTCTLLPASKKSFVDESKKSSFAERVSLYKSASEMIIDHPMGLGLGSFVNGLIPYRLNQDFKPHEFEYADQPHSEILKWGVQFGWLGFILAIGLLIYVFIDLVLAKNMFLISSFLTLIPQLLFQFPFENPMGILLIGVFAGLWLKTKKTDSAINFNWKYKAAFSVLALLTVVHSFIFITSIVIESQFSTNYEKTSLMCSIYPINHRNCNFKNVQLLEKNETTQFRLELKNELNFSYMTSDLQRILPIYFQKIKNEKYLCEDILIYKLMYPVQKYFNDQDVRFCSKYTVPIQYNNPVQFRSDYRSWLEKTLM